MNNYKPILFFIILYFLLHTSCQNKTTVSEIENITKEQTTDTCEGIKPDTMVGDFYLKNSKSVLDVVKQKYKLRESPNSMPFLKFSNYNNTHTITLFLHYGTIKYEFAEMEITPYKESDTAVRIGNLNLITNNGITLGSNKKTVIQFIGKCYETRKRNGTEIISYHLNDFDKSKFLQRYNYPEYYAEYEFRNDSLIRFKFGFSYP